MSLHMHAPVHPMERKSRCLCQPAGAPSQICKLNQMDMYMLHPHWPFLHVCWLALQNST